MGSRTLVVAGATGYGVWPANTLVAARRCLDEPRLDGFEIDVQLTADSHVVAHHDYRLSPDATRLNGRWLETRGPPLKAISLADLRRHDVGALLAGSKSAARYPHRETVPDTPIPTLPELLEVLRAAPGPRRWLYIEIKTDPTNAELTPDPDDIVCAVLRDVADADWVDRTKIIAFDWQVLRKTKALDSRLATSHLTIPTSLAVTVKPRDDGTSPWTDGYDAAAFGGSELAAIKAHGGEEWSPYFTDVTAERVAEAARLGLRVGPWGLSSAEDIQRLIDLGVFSATVSGPAWAGGQVAAVAR
jgi:glycerophosphoryl diester phosphodiesterase